MSIEEKERRHFLPVYTDKPNPCWKCRARSITCHSTCEAYLEWTKDNQRKSKTLRKKIYNDNVGIPKRAKKSLK